MGNCNNSLWGEFTIKVMIGCLIWFGVETDV